MILASSNSPSLFQTENMMSIHQQACRINTVQSMTPTSQRQLPSSSSSSEGPGPHDVIRGRGKLALMHPGNKYFRSLVERASIDYSKTTSRMERSYIVTGIVKEIKSKGNGFIKQTSQGEWVPVSDSLAREKIGQQMRELLSTKYKSSHSAKKRRQRVVSTKMSENMDNFFGSNKAIYSVITTLPREVEMVTAATSTSNTPTSTVAATPSSSTEEQIMNLSFCENVLIHTFHTFLKNL